MATGGHGIGYPRTIFPDAADIERYICSEQEHVLQDPVQNTLCGHHSCRFCIHALIATEESPRCRRCLLENNEHTPVLNHKVFPDRNLQREMEKLQVQCPGCHSWSGSFRDLDRDHWPNCPSRTQAKLHSQFQLESQSRPDHPKGPPDPPSTEEMNSRVTALETKLAEIMLETTNRQELQHQERQLSNTTFTANEGLETLYQRTEQLERTIYLQEIALAELNAAREAGPPSLDGTLLWKIKNFQQKKQRAVEGKEVSIFSNEFFTSRYGYRLKACVYLNGDGMGRGTHLSLFLVVCKGEYDSLLQWPFQQKVILQLVKRGGQSYIQTFIPNPNTRATQRPTLDRNTGCGLPEFAPQQTVEEQFVKDDTLYICIHVDTRDLRDPAAKTYTL